MEFVRDNFCETSNKHYEGAMSQGNGYLFVRGSFEEGLVGHRQGESYTRAFKSVTTEVQRHPVTKYGTYIPLIMGDNPELNEVIVNLPYFMDFHAAINSDPIDMQSDCISDFSMVLGMDNGVVTRRFVYTTKEGAQIQASYERFASRFNKHMFVQKISYSVLKGSAQLQIRSGIDTRVTTNGYNHLTHVVKVGTHRRIEVTMETDLHHRVIERSYLSSDAGSLMMVDHEWHGNYALHEGEDVTFIKRSFVYTDLDDDMESADDRELLELDKSYDLQYKENHEQWKLLWDVSDIHIKGNDKDQEAVRFSIYHLLRCKDQEEYRTSICAKGFAGEAYYGRYFWDSEIFLLPFYIYNHPKMARNLLRYRYHTLKGARENAKRYNAKGARYPWHSATTGTEQCSLWEYGDNEVHVTADIVYGIWHYYQGTGDKEFLMDYGIEIILETARYWLERVDRDEQGRYHIYNVMGPDEYTAFNMDNTFTNHLVRFNLELASQMVILLEKEAPLRLEQLYTAIQGLREDILLFEKVGKAIYLPDYEAESYISQSDNFHQYPKVDFDNLWTDRHKPFGFFMTQEQLYRTQVLKQADSILLAMLFKQDFSSKLLEGTYDYFEPLTTHDSSLSPINHGIIAGWIGRKEEAQRFLDYALGLDYDVARQGAKEGIHIANCGAIHSFIMQTVAGIDTAFVNNQDKPESTSSFLPNRWEEVRFRLMWQQQLYEVVVCKSGVDIQVCL